MGKESRNRRRAAARTGGGWGAVAAARDAQRRRRQAAANIAGHPYLHARGVEITSTHLAEVARSFENQGAPSESAKRLAHKLVLAARGVRPPYGNVDEIASADLSEDAELLADAELFIVSPAMQRAAIAAAETLTPVDVATLVADEDLPALRGVVVLSEPIIVRGPAGALADLRAFAWKPGNVFLGTPAEWSPGVRVADFLDADGPVESASFASARAAAKDAGHPYPLIVPNVHFGMRADGLALTFTDDARAQELDIHGQRTDSINEAIDPVRTEFNRDDHSVSATYGGNILDDPEANFTPRFMFAFWRLCQQRITTVGRFLDEPGAGPVAAALAESRIVRLRGWDTDAGDEPAAGRRYRHRWVVRMHKVRQWYPSLGVHKVLWRGPYIKGPDGAPLLDGDKVQALVR